jgi:hypothetical protein
MSTLTTKQTRLVEQISALIPTARPNWWPAGEPTRLYLASGRRDAKVWIEFDNASEVAGAAVKTWVDAGNQPAAWVNSQKKRLANWAMPAFYACLLVGGGEDSASAFLAELANTNTELYDELVDMIADAAE